jgi:CRP-like cAMP-binding protein
MALADDLVVVILLASAGFFVALSFGLLMRYRQISQRISASSDLGRDLWQALEQRMKKQDERILDMMGRLDVIQSRVMTAVATQPPPPTVVSPPVSSQPRQQQPGSQDVTGPRPAVQQPESHLESQTSQAPGTGFRLDETQTKVMRLLVEGPRNTRQLTDSLGMSREHTSRVMKGLFDRGLVQRNDTTKPFLYQLSDEGRRYAVESG